MIKQYIRDKNRNPIGLVLYDPRRPDDFLWSLCNIKKGDKFDKSLAHNVAYARNRKGVKEVPPQPVLDVVTQIQLRLKQRKDSLLGSSQIKFPLSTGMFFQSNDGTYLHLVQVANSEVALICGDNRWRNPISVNDVNSITKDEFKRMIGPRLIDDFTYMPNITLDVLIETYFKEEKK